MKAAAIRAKKQAQRVHHVVTGPGANQVKCLHCGDTIEFRTPLPCERFVVASYALVALHASCKPGDPSPIARYEEGVTEVLR